MREFSPLLFAGALVGVFATAFLLAYIRVRRKKEDMGFEREMSDREIVRRLMAYARPYRGRFVLVLLIMLVAILLIVFVAMLLLALYQQMGAFIRDLYDEIVLRL